MGNRIIQVIVIQVVFLGGTFFIKDWARLTGSLLVTPAELQVKVVGITQVAIGNKGVIYSQGGKLQAEPQA